MRRFILFMTAPALLVTVVLSCSLLGESNIAVIWTDRPEFAFYADSFNASQNQFKVEVRYFDFPARELMQSVTQGAASPDIVAGSWLKSVATRSLFRPLSGYFNDQVLSKELFYPGLLAMGRVGDKQYLLPVSFNAPVLVFARDQGERISNPFTIGFNEIQELSKAYNTENKGVYTRMGFSPLWDDHFLFVIAALYNASFQEDSPLVWDSVALDRAMRFAYDWTFEVNTSLQAEEDFGFKYFFEPPEKLVLSGRILCTYMESNNLFTLGEDRQNNLDFRWIAEENTIPLIEGSVYIGLPKKGKSPKAAGAFVRWFFRSDTQRQLLANSKSKRMNEMSFGISGGFSALRPVTEQVFPQFYPGLLGRMPPADFLSPANILPANWTLLKERVILPYLHDRARSNKGIEVYSLERRVADWLRVNR